MPGPPADFRALYDAELAYVIRTLQRLGVRDPDIEDAAQEVFVVAFRRSADRDPSRAVRPWLFGIAYRVVGNYLQKAHRRRELPSETIDAPALEPSPRDATERNQRRAVLRGALATLDLEHRAVAVLHDIDGVAAPEIAAVLGIPLNTVYSRVRTARQKLLDATRAIRGGP